MEFKNSICFICGFDFSNEINEGIQKWPFIFCTCCDFEYGIEDNEYDCYIRKRKEWIENGLRFNMQLWPNGYEWTIDIAIQQLHNLKKVDLANYPIGYKMNPNYSTQVDYDKVRSYWDLYRES